jgi:hypothetical protein
MIVRSRPTAFEGRRGNPDDDGVIDRAVRLLRGLIGEEHRCYPPGAGDWHPVASATRAAARSRHYTCPECSQVWSTVQRRSAA